MSMLCDRHFGHGFGGLSTISASITSSSSGTVAIVRFAAMSRRFDRFIDALSNTIVSERACNQYSRIEGDLRGNAIRRRNLRLYLSDLDAIGPRMLLVGEAPSYRGGRLTGIPFVSETVMMAGADRGYRKATVGPRLSTEARAKMVVATIREVEAVTNC